MLQREFREVENQAKDAEKEAHAHSRQSAIGPDGMIIPARARKKRRLDEELEGLLEAMEVLPYFLASCCSAQLIAVVGGELSRPYERANISPVFLTRHRCEGCRRPFSTM